MRRYGQHNKKNANDIPSRTIVKDEASTMITMGNFDISGRTTGAGQTPVCIKKKMQKHSIDVRFHKSFAQNHTPTFSHPRETTDAHDTRTFEQITKKRFSCKPARSHGKDQLSNHNKVDHFSDLAHLATSVKDDPESRRSISNTKRTSGNSEETTPVHAINKSISVGKPDIATSGIFGPCTNIHNNGIRVENHVASSLRSSIDLQDTSSFIDLGCNRITEDNSSNALTLKEESSHIDAECTAEHTMLQTGRLAINEKACSRLQQTQFGNFQSPKINVKIEKVPSALLKKERQDPDDFDATHDVWNKIAIAGYELNENDDFEPIPYSVYAAGSPVDADGHGSSDQRIFSPTSDTSSSLQLVGTNPMIHLCNYHSSTIKTFCSESPTMSEKRCKKRKILASSAQDDEAKVTLDQSFSGNKKRDSNRTNFHCTPSIFVGSCKSDAQQVDPGSMSSKSFSRLYTAENDLSLHEAACILSQSKTSRLSSVDCATGKSKASYHDRAGPKVDDTPRTCQKHHQIAGLDDHMIDKMLMSPLFTNEIEGIDLFPYQAMASGVAVDADYHLLTTHDRTDLLCASVQTTLTKDKKKKMLAKSNRNCKKAGKKRKVAAVELENKPTSGRIESVGPDSWQMAVVFRMVVYLEETAVGNENSEKIEKIHIAIDHCNAHHAKRVPKYMHLPGAVFEELVNLLGGKEFLHLYESAKTFHHPRLEEARREKLLAANERLTSKIGIGNAMSADPNLIQIAIAYGWYLATEKENTADRASLKDAFEQGSLLVLQMSEESRTQLWNKIVLNRND